MALAHILGYPRIGPRRELKFALEAHWRGELDARQLLAAAGRLKEDHWRRQRAAGLDFLVAGDHSLYDHVLDTAQDLGVLPRRAGDEESLAEYFRYARGDSSSHALEMTKWFDTNYHYLVPELAADPSFAPDPSRLMAEARRCAGIHTSRKVALLGPLSFLRLSKHAGQPFDRLVLLPALVRAYGDLLHALRREGVEWVQLEEPCLTLELGDDWIRGYEEALRQWTARSPRLLLTTYFDSIDCDPGRIATWPFAGIHLDLVRAPSQLGPWLESLPDHWVLSAGVVDGRNIWRNDLARSLALLEPVHSKLGDRLWVGTSCSLLHVPVSVEAEADLDPQVRRWLAFADEKMREVKTIAAGLTHGRDSIAGEIAASDEVVRHRRAASTSKSSAKSPHPSQRTPGFAERRRAQQSRMALPLLPTTTIGSFPQTDDLRSARAAYKRKEITERDYTHRIHDEIRRVIAFQEEIGLDVLVHGEPERNDMVEFFAQHLEGFATTANGWVQSYGSRCVKPPIVHGRVERRAPITVDVAQYAQSLTKRPVKGMLTGPITILKWSFPRDDIPLRDVARQIAMAVRGEVRDLQHAGIRVVQIDEPALRESLPLKRADAAAWLDFATAMFRLASSAADPETQIHTHMCYSDFGDILPAVAAMDADVVTIETSRSRMELLAAFGTFKYPNDLGPGVYDIHSPRTPSVEEMEALIRKAARVVPAERLWVNPDCGLKTRGWAETREALANMVEAARRVRVSFAG
jgi:5-methyltetrahydropteroyltriglutamate--homocysteine methyltransferase